MNQIFTESNFFIETEVPEGELIISRTNLKGVITYANEVFAEISGYSPEELVGKSHNIVRHPDMPKSVFKEMWKTLKSGKKWSGYVKNMRKDKGFYWVYAEISQVFDKSGNLVEYKSMRSAISNDKKREMQNFYDNLKKRDRDSVRIVEYIPFEEYSNSFIDVIENK